MNERGIEHLAQLLRDVVNANRVTGMDTGRAVMRVLSEQPCGSEGSYGMVSNLQHFRCVKRWHNDIRHKDMTDQDLANYYTPFQAPGVDCPICLVDTGDREHEPSCWIGQHLAVVAPSERGR